MGKYIGNIVTDGGPTGYSCQFNGSTQYLTTSSSAISYAGDFTVECWFNTTTTTTYASLYSDESAGGAGGTLLLNNGSANGQITVYIASAVSNFASTSTGLNDGRWHHVAFSRSGSTLRLFIDGALQNTMTASGTLTTPSTFQIGNSYYSSRFFGGYISNFRVTSTAVYTAAFSPPTQLANITNTSLLACQQPSIIDASSNNFTITNTGGVTVSTLTPFTAYAPYTPAAGDASPGIWKQSDLLTFTQNRQINMYDANAPYNTLLLNGNGTNGAQNNTFLATPPGGVGQYTGSFNGSTQYLNIADNAALQVGSSDFTIEAWIYPSSLPSAGNYKTFWSKRTALSGAGGYGGALLAMDSTGALQFFVASNSTTWGLSGSSTGFSITTGVWQHLAMVRSGNNLILYKNGVAGTTVSLTFSVYDTGAFTLMAGSSTGGQNVDGYMSNFRLVKGTAVYTTGFTPPTLPLTPIPNTSLLTCQSATFIDNSPNNFTITNNGTATIVNPNTLPSITRAGSASQGSFTPYGSVWSNYFGAANTFFTTPDSAATTLGSNDFTFESWVYPTSYAANIGTVVSKWQGVSTRSYLFGVTSTGALTFAWNSTGSLTSTAGDVPLNKWSHIAAVRSGNTLTLYVNGVSVATTALSVSVGATSTLLAIGINYEAYALSVAGFNFLGYMSNLRLVNGTALYTSAFTPSLLPLTAVTNTFLLTCQSNRFRDASSNNYSITVTGTPIIQRFAPFVTNAPYEVPSSSGSMYFNGSTDWLTLAATSNFVCTGDFTLEYWKYSNGYEGGRDFQGGGGYGCEMGFAGYIYFIDSTGTILLQSALPFAISYKWTHVAFVRSGTTLKCYINGTLLSSITLSATVTFSKTISVASAGGAGYTVNGYIADLRLVNGTAVYTANFTPPTTPLTPINNTQLLLQGTNAGITDGTGANVLTTVGDAQVSTAVVKYGSGSLKFDGTGDYLTIPNVASIAFGTGNFTIEFWCNLTAYSSPNGCVVRLGNELSSSGLFVGYVSTDGVFVYGNSGTITTTGSGFISTGTWQHIAVVRNSGSIQIYVNGVARGTAASYTQDITPTINSYVGGYPSAQYLNGYIDDLRITKGVARYTANFTPPTSQLQNC